MNGKFRIISTKILILSKEQSVIFLRSLAEKDVNEKVCIFAKTIKNILSNFILHKKILCDDRDPPWISDKVKKLINEKNTASNPILKMIKISNHFKSFKPFKISYYLQLKFPNNNITHGFLKD